MFVGLMCFLFMSFIWGKNVLDLMTLHGPLLVIHQLSKNIQFCLLCVWLTIYNVYFIRLFVIPRDSRSRDICLKCILNYSYFIILSAWLVCVIWVLIDMLVVCFWLVELSKSPNNSLIWFIQGRLWLCTTLM